MTNKFKQRMEIRINTNIETIADSVEWKEAKNSRKQSSMPAQTMNVVKTMS